MYVFWKIEPVGFADLLDMACERKRKGVKDNAKDFGLSLWGNGTVIYSTWPRMQVE